MGAKLLKNIVFYKFLLEIFCYLTNNDYFYTEKTIKHHYYEANIGYRYRYQQPWLGSC